MPETVPAWQQGESLRQQFGDAGGQLFADAFQVAVYWWTHLPDTERWVQRAWSAGLEARNVRAAPVVVLPEAARLAQRMVDFEQLGEQDCSAREKWLAGVQRDMAVWDVDAWVGRQPLLAWLQRHHDRPAQSGSLGSSRTKQPVGGLRLPGGHKQNAQLVRPLGEFSCLPWQLGQPACSM
ncbi:hypothetical protein AB0G83_34265 [Streptomyces klenkii]|uniref:hypothetical protein n=1 Tax=Streptomyces klenkii TaxID=1420899 RepID=UPI0033DD09F9